MQHIMLDLETLDTAPSAVVLSIGAVAFKMSGGLGASFYVELVNDIDAQQMRGRTIAGDCVRCWMQQEAAARRMFADVPHDGVQRVDTLSALSQFSDFVASNGGPMANIWSNGADFDNVILSSLYKAYGVSQPWKYTRSRCYRTVKSLNTELHNQLQSGSIRHNALDDAVSQALHLQKMLSH